MGRGLRVALVALLVVCLGYLADRMFLDGLLGTSLGVVLPDDTEYAPGYSDERFRDIEPEMTERNVLDALGRPLDQTITSVGETVWRYSRSRKDSNYHVRSVVLRYGKVVGTIHEFYVD
jgi:hypothetical protein